MFLFVYGAIAPTDLAEKIGFSGEPYQAYIKDAAREFRGKNGLASLSAKNGEVVYGYAITIVQSELQGLKDWEAKGQFVNLPTKIEINFGQGFTTRMGMTFVANHRTEKAKPTMEYLSKVASVVAEFWRSPTGKEITPVELRANPRHAFKRSGAKAGKKKLRFEEIFYPGKKGR